MKKITRCGCVFAVFVVVLGHWTAASTRAVSLASESRAGAGAEDALYPLLPGFPFKIEGQINKSSPSIADIDNDGDNEILLTNYAGKVFVYTANGSPMPGWPVSTRGRIIMHLALGDLNGDGDLEVVVGAGTEQNGVPGYIHVFQPNGTPLPGWPKQIDRYGTSQPSKISTIALADVDKDSDLEIIAGTNNNVLGSNAPPDLEVPNLYVWHHTGALASGNWPAADRPAILGTLAVGDLTSDGNINIVTGRDYQWLFAYDRSGRDLPGWPVETPLLAGGSTKNSPRIVHKLANPDIADLDGDGQFEVIVAGERKMPGSTIDVNMDLLVLQPNGTRRPGWETPAAGIGILAEELAMYPAPAIADMDNNGDLDIVVPTQDGWIRAYAPNKTLLWQFNFAQGKVLHASEPVIGDVDGDGFNEVVFGVHDPYKGNAGPVGVYILEHTGALKSGTPLAVEAPGVFTAPTLGDLNQDGKLDIVAASRFGTIYAWNTRTTYQPYRVPWPMARQNLRRTAFFDPALMAPNLSGSVLAPNASHADEGQELTFTVRLVRRGYPLDEMVQLTGNVPAGLAYVPGSLSASHGVVNDGQAPALQWTGMLSDTASVQITYRTTVTRKTTGVIVTSIDIDGGSAGALTRTALIIVNGHESYLPFMNKAQP